MSQTKRINYRVVIPVSTHPWISSKGTQEDHERLMSDYCRAIVALVQRHLDVEPASVESDVVCRFCEYPWKSALDDNGLPACCQAAIDEAKKNR